MARTVVKEVPFARLYSDGTIVWNEVRWSYPHLLVPKGGMDRSGKPIEPSFSVTGLAPKKTHREAMLLVKGEMDRILLEHKLKDIGADKKALRNGNLAGRDEYKGMYTISLREQVTRPPSIRDSKGNKLAVTDAGLIVPGCYGNLLFRLWWQDNQFGKRINGGIVAAQILKKPFEAFGEGRVSEEEIDETFDGDTGGWEDEDLAAQAEDL